MSNEMLPLTLPGQKRHLHDLVSRHGQAKAETDKLRRQYIEAKNAFEAQQERVESLERKLGRYVGRKRELVSVLVDGVLFLIEWRESREMAHVKRILFIRKSEGG